MNSSSGFKMSPLHRFIHFHTSVRLSVTISELHVVLPQICLTANSSHDIWPLTAKTQARIRVTFCEKFNEIPEDGVPEMWRSPQWNGQPPPPKNKKKNNLMPEASTVKLLRLHPLGFCSSVFSGTHRWTRELLDSCCPSVLVGLWVRCVNVRERTVAWWGHDTSKLILRLPIAAETDINLAACSLQGMWVPNRTTPIYKVA